ncbi:MAG: hypothetical protein EXS38_00765 [Opitutus sp.]|nr:hypothetical protein [Opitutus sp.]
MKHSLRLNHLRHALARSAPVFGPNLQIPSPDLVEIIGLAGFDFVMLDCEHGAAAGRLPELLVACDAAKLTSIVRVAGHGRAELLTPLELGAGGVQVPFVNTAEEARVLVRHTKFPPLGERGVSLVTRAARFGFADGRTYRAAANRETLLIVQVESREGARNAAAIAAVPGVDAIFIGPADLAQSFGYRADVLVPATVRVIAGIVRAVAGLKPVCISAFDRHDVARWHRMGIRGFLTSSIRPLGRAFSDSRAELIRGIPRR